MEQSTSGWQIYLVFIALFLAVTSCSGERITTPTPERTKLAALLVGELVEAQGCLRVNTRDMGTN